MTRSRWVEQNRDVIVGIKARIGRHAGADQGIGPLKVARQVAERVGMSVMVHLDQPLPVIEDVLAELRPGERV